MKKIKDLEYIMCPAVRAFHLVMIAFLKKKFRI